MERKTLQEIRRKTTKKFALEPCRVGEREKNLKTFEKGELNKSRSNLKKTLIHDFRLIENQFRLIETYRGSLKNFKHNFY